MSGPKVIVLGFVFQDPIGGVLWQTLHYLIGLRRLGFDVYYGECHGQWVLDPLGTETLKMLERFGFGDRWFCWDVKPSEKEPIWGRSYGLALDDFIQACQDAEAVFNLSARHVLQLHEFLMRIPRRVYVETDPAVAQLKLSKGDADFHELVAGHNHYFTFGENINSSDCLVPRADYPYQSTRQPILCDMWESPIDARASTFTTIGKWKQDKRLKRGGVLGDQTYHWSKHFEFLKFVDLPGRASNPFEVCMAKIDDVDRALLVEHGWEVSDAGTVSSTLDGYRDFIQRSRGEFTVAKDLNVRLRSGWFSDRSACYLAAGRPVITQDTAFGNILPTGEGLFAFLTMDDILAAVEAINSDYRRHCRAAQEIAREYFGADRVLRAMVERVGLEAAAAVG